MSKTYKDKIKHPLWQKKRLEILDRDNYQCIICGSKDKTLHVHHRYYSRGDPWGISNEALVTLCEGCHEKEEVNLARAISRLIGASKLICTSAFIIDSLASTLLYFENNPKEAQRFIVDMQQQAYNKTKKISVKELTKQLIG